LVEVIENDTISRVNGHWNKILVVDSAKILQYFPDDNAIPVNEFIKLMKEEVEENVNKGVNSDPAEFDMRKTWLYMIMIAVIFVFVLLCIVQVYYIIQYQRSIRPPPETDEMMVKVKKLIEENMKLKKMLAEQKNDVYNKIDNHAQKYLIRRTMHLSSDIASYWSRYLADTAYVFGDISYRGSGVIYNGTVEGLHVLSYFLVYAVIQGGNFIIQVTFIFSNVLLQVVELAFLFLSTVISLSYQTGITGVFDVVLYIFKLLSIFI